MLSLTGEYALRGVLYIADRAPRLVRVEAMAEELGLPKNYLSKTLNRLTRSGILESHRGPAGGFRLAIDPETLSLATVIEGFDASPGERSCLLGRPNCSDTFPCPAHHRWKALGEQIAAFFNDTTVADLLRDPSRHHTLTETLYGRRESRSARSA